MTGRGERDMTKKKTRSGRRLEIPAGAIYALLAAISLICVTAVAVAFADDGSSGVEEDKMEEIIKIPHLYIEDVFFRSYENEGITVEITIYVTNDGTDDANNVQAHIWPVVDESNIATDMKEIQFDDIMVNQTRHQKVEILLNAGTLHSVEILVFESNMLVLKGRAEVSTQGQGASSYTNVEVRGSDEDVDYDGMPDEWERYYGLDPNDASDASLDRDGDGIDNIMEYRLNRDPNVNPAMADDDDDDDSAIGSWAGEAKDGNGFAIGASLFFVLIVGVVIVLIIAAVVSSNKARKRAKEEEFFKDRPPKRKEQPRRMQFEHVVKEGAREEDPEATSVPFMDNHSP
jgi:hypothetical protein